MSTVEAWLAGGFLIIVAGLLMLPRMILVVDQWADRRSGIDALVRDFGPDPAEPPVLCGDCKAVLDTENVAVTCGDHMLCSDCDGAFNPCGECRAERRMAGVDEDQAYDWAREGWVR